MSRSSTSARAIHASPRIRFIRQALADGVRGDDGLPDRPRACPSCAQRSPVGSHGASASTLDPDRGAHPDARLERGDLQLRPGVRGRSRRQGYDARPRSRPTPCTSAAPSSPARGSFAYRFGRRTAFFPDLDALDAEMLDRDRAHLGQLPQQPDRAPLPHARSTPSWQGLPGATTSSSARTRRTASCGSTSRQPSALELVGPLVASSCSTRSASARR